MQSNSLRVNKTAHYYTIGKINNDIKRVIFAFHGYGQAARKFIHKFDELDDGKTLVVCPEGLNRFYWKNFTGEVVSSWMTKQDREDDIRDNNQYLNQLFDLIVSQLSKEIKITVLGFSQGCPTASRWVSSQQPKINHLVLWAGQLAHDEDFSKSKEYFLNKKLLFIYGNEDEFLPFGYKERQLELAHKSSLVFQVMEFDGKHEIKRNVLKKVLFEIDSIQTLF